MTFSCFQTCFSPRRLEYINRCGRAERSNRPRSRPTLTPFDPLCQPESLRDIGEFLVFVDHHARRGYLTRPNALASSLPPATPRSAKHTDTAFESTRPAAEPSPPPPSPASPSPTS